MMQRQRQTTMLTSEFYIPLLMLDMQLKFQNENHKIVSESIHMFIKKYFLWAYDIALVFGGATKLANKIL